MTPPANILDRPGAGSPTLEKAELLLDFDNVFPGPVNVESNEYGDYLVDAIGRLLQAFNQLRSIRVRLYGGWMQSGTLSKRGSEVASVMANLDPFPMITSSGVIRGTVELATSMIFVKGTVFSNTYRTRTSPPRLRLSGTPFPDGCVECGTSCPARILQSFTSSPRRVCPATGCAVSSASAFVIREQKMVDTLITCDLIDIGHTDPPGLTAILSSDVDFIPSLILASRRYSSETEYLLYDQANRVDDHHRDLLQTHGVHTSADLSAA